MSIATHCRASIVAATVAIASLPAQDPELPPAATTVTPIDQIQIPRDPDGGAPVAIKLTDALRMGLENNTVLRINELLPYQAREDVRAARAAFEPELFADATASRSRDPARNIFQPGIERESYSGSVGLRQLTPSGGLFDLTFSPSRLQQTTNVPGFPSKQFSSEVTVTVTQPLLRGAWTDYTLRDVHSREALRAASTFRYDRAVQDTAIGVVEAYWNLVFARENYKVAFQALELATEQLDRTERKIRVGELAPLDRVADEAEVARRREELVTAENEIRDREDDLRRQVLDDGDGRLWGRSFDPVSPIGEFPERTELDWRDLARVAKRFRPDLRALRADVAVAEISERAASRDVLPQLDLVGRYTSDGVSNSFNQAWVQTSGLDFPDWSVGLELSLPLGNNSALAQRDRARLEVERTRRVLYSAELDVQLEVRDAVRRLRTLAETIQRGQESVRLAVTNLRREVARKDAGTSTSFEVTRRNQELQEARSRLLRNQLDYRIAEANLLYVQGLLGGAELPMVPVDEPEPSDGDAEGAEAGDPTDDGKGQNERQPPR